MSENKTKKRNFNFQAVSNAQNKTKMRKQTQNKRSVALLTTSRSTCFYFSLPVLPLSLLTL